MDAQGILDYLWRVESSFRGDGRGRFCFLGGVGDEFRALFSPGIDRGYGWLWFDSFLAGQFAVSHSAMLWPPIRSRLNRKMPAALSGASFARPRVSA